MGLELSILGIRKIKDEEIKELTGKTRKEMEKSKFFRKFFPNAPYDSWYWSYSQKEISKDGRYENVMHLFFHKNIYYFNVFGHYIFCQQIALCIAATYKNFWKEKLT